MWPFRKRPRYVHPAVAAQLAAIEQIKRFGGMTQMLLGISSLTPRRTLSLDMAYADFCRRLDAALKRQRG